jgi:hypothetical protein
VNPEHIGIGHENPEKHLEQTRSGPSDASEALRRRLYTESPKKPIEQKHDLRDTQEQPWQKEAREGFQRFEQSHENGDSNWKDFLTKTESGKELQAVYLGIKPLMSIYPGKIRDERMVGMIHHHADKIFPC